ncbi:hypothetical protein V6767_12865 [Martelella sp. FLE1502]
MENPLEKFDTPQLEAELRRRGALPHKRLSGLDWRRNIERLGELIADGDTVEALHHLREIHPSASLPPPETIMRQRRRITGKPSEPAHVHR